MDSAALITSPSTRGAVDAREGAAVMTQTLTTENQTLSTEKKYRVIQWGIGNVGTLAMRHLAHNPAYEVVGVLCNRPEKVGKDAGELCGKAPTGVLATNDKDVIEALEADCV